MKINFKKVGIASLLLLITGRAFSKNSPLNFSVLTPKNIIRKCDPFGCGYFGAGRGSRPHNGLDFTIKENDVIKAPFDSVITRYGHVYADDNRFQLVEIKGVNQWRNYTAKVMYIKSLLNVNSNLKKGDFLCRADDITKKFNSKMAIHVHFELYKNGKLINPTPFFK